MLYRIQNGSVSFGADTILEDIEFEINEKEKIAIVGRNGCGKSTLLKCIVGEIEMEEGTGEQSFSVTKVKNPTIGYLKQIAFEDENVKMIDEVMKVFKPILDIENKMAKLLKEIEENADEEKIKEYSNLNDRFELLGGYTYKKEYSVMIKKFGFTEEEKNKPLCEFSGGQRTKIAFIKLLLSHPDILLLDEPTNHLDVSAIKWLEGYIKAYKSAVVVVSHDRMFIEKTADKIYEIEYGETKCYRGNYSAFEKQKRENYQKMLKDYEAQREEIKRLMRLVEKFRYKATKASMVQSKLKQIEHMKIVDKPDRYDLKTFHTNFQPKTESVKKVLSVKGLSIGYNKPLANISFDLMRGERLGIIGDNGIGKSTFVKTIVGEIIKLGGKFEFGVNTEIGYFNQQMAQYSSDKTIFEDFYDEFPFLNETEVRTSLGSFLFSGEDVFKCVNDLSGGERVRLALCKMFKRRPNVLILDEPTNHMDIVGKETLENMLSSFEGTVIVVSHDRYFINKVADRLLVFENGEANFYPCSYNEYELIERERQEKEENESINQEQKEKVQQGDKKTFTTPLKEKSKKERKAKKLEEQISKNDEMIESLNSQLENPEVYSDYVKVSEIQNEMEKLTQENESLTEEYFEILEQLENM